VELIACQRGLAVSSEATVRARFSSTASFGNDGKPWPALLVALQALIETSLELACHLRRAVRRPSLRDHLAE
jgi:hypothetical protein